MPKNRKTGQRILTIFLCCLLLTACADTSKPNGETPVPDKPGIITLAEVPEYSGKIYIEINGNEPDFPDIEENEPSFERYSELDSLGRCGEAYANVGPDLMPTGKRGAYWPDQTDRLAYRKV